MQVLAFCHCFVKAGYTSRYVMGRNITQFLKGALQDFVYVSICIYFKKTCQINTPYKARGVYYYAVVARAA